MRILFLTDNFPPEYNAPATRTFEHCREWVKNGAEVTVVTCFPNFPGGKIFDGYKNERKRVEYIEGIKVIRVWSFVSSNRGVFKRSLDFLSFSVTGFIAGLREKCDLIVATSPQFFTALSGFFLGYFKRKPWVFEVRDLWPESIKAVEAVRSNWIISFLERIELFLYRSASKVIVVTDSFKANLMERGITPDKIFVIKNGVDLSSFHPKPKALSLRKQLGIDQKFVVGYVGTHGLAHSLDFIIGAIARLNDSSYHFVFIGDGAEKPKLVAMAQEQKATNITFLDPVRKSEVPLYLSMLDVSLVPLRRSTTFESVIPSKVFESVAMGVPILLGVNGETRKIIEHYGAGIYFEPENLNEFIQRLHLMKSMLEGNGDYFSSGCKEMAFAFDRQRLAREMLAVLSNN